jgi:hypothetical protein
MGYAKYLLEIGEEMDLARGVDCLECNSRVRASEWSGDYHIKIARSMMRQGGGHEYPICWRCAKTIYSDD